MNNIQSSPVTSLLQNDSYSRLHECQHSEIFHPLDPEFKDYSLVIVEICVPRFLIYERVVRYPLTVISFFPKIRIPSGLWLSWSSRPWSSNYTTYLGVHGLTAGFIFQFPQLFLGSFNGLFPSDRVVIGPIFRDWLCQQSDSEEPINFSRSSSMMRWFSPTFITNPRITSQVLSIKATWVHPLPFLVHVRLSLLVSSVLLFTRRFMV